MENKVIWTPQPQQARFMERPEYECLYGGAAGGGKSDAMVAEALRQVHIPHYKALILRKTYPQLSELIEKSKLLYPRTIRGARYNNTDHMWTFPSGAKIVFGSMHRSDDKLNYQGKAYDFIGFDELTHFTLEEYMYLYSRNRPNGPGTRVYIRATTNPGGVGHGWVKDRFITAAPPLTPIKTIVDVRQPDGSIKQIKRKRIFVPATVFDNQKLLNNDPNYIANLAMMPEAERNALLYGDWDSFSGQVFREWKNDSTHHKDRKWTHVIKPFLIPETWRIYRGFDWGYSKPFSVGWFAVDHDGRMYRTKELYGCTNTPNEGVKWTPQEIAKAINEIEDADPNLHGKSIIGVADPSIYEESKGESIASMMESEKVYWEKADNARLAGKMQCHYRLAFDKDGIPMLYVFDTCKQFIRCIPNLIYDEHKVEDVDTSMEDHNYDEWRYVMMENPINPRINAADPVDILAQQYDPLNLHQSPEQQYDRYNFMNVL